MVIGKIEKIKSQLELKAIEHLDNCGNCAQASFLALRDEFGLGGDDVLKALTPMPGIALFGQTCGVVIGSLAAIGMVNGRGVEELGEYRKYKRSLPAARRMVLRFAEEVGSTQCGDLLEIKFGRRYDLANPVDAVMWASSGAKEICGEITATGVRIAAEIIEGLLERKK